MHFDNAEGQPLGTSWPHCPRLRSPPTSRIRPTRLLFSGGLLRRRTRTIAAPSIRDGAAGRPLDDADTGGWDLLNLPVATHATSPTTVVLLHAYHSAVADNTNKVTYADRAERAISVNRSPWHHDPK